MTHKLGLVVAVMLAGGGCTRYRPAADTLVVALGAQPPTLDPRYATDANGIRIGGLIFESLVHAGPGFLPEPEAAERWTYANKIYKFYLRQDLKFHNGRPVNPSDIEFSFAYYRGGKSPFASTLDLIRDVNARVENGRVVVEIRVSHASDRFLVGDLPSVKILPREEILALGPDFKRQMIGTGPFRFEREDLNEIRLKGVRSGILRLIFKIVRDDFTRFQKLLTEEVDLAINEIPADKVREFENRRENFQVFKSPGLSMTYIVVNFRDPLLRRREVREALARALDREEIMRFKLAGMADEATSILTPLHPYFAAGMHNLPHDPNRAREEIDRLGLAGQRLVLKTSNSPQAIDNGRVLGNQLARTGFKVDLESYEWGTFYSDISKGRFQLATMKWVGIVDPDIYRSIFHSRELPPGRNRGAYINRELDKLLDQGAEEEDRARRIEIYGRVQRLVHEDLALIPLWYEEQVAIARRAVLDFNPSIRSDFLPLARVRKREP